MAENKVLENEILRFVHFYPFIAFPYYCSIWRRSCGDHMGPRCVRTASWWRPRRPHCAVTALPLRTHCVHTALIQIAVGTPSHGAKCTKCAPWHGVLGDPRRTPPWCDKGLMVKYSPTNALVCSMLENGVSRLDQWMKKLVGPIYVYRNLTLAAA